ncbi:hypothetical protein HG536_0D00930 [Torulaspora globosa]|uniref:54S ribosomal protein L22, mitochondrial n=1 Tax=Torulaspora globosa TaxID=48254 RepID=A0A7G3ZGD5_9SACH|nr:uncharacterized protein HG536_0D00930 [Torulaspora globosa]QLL32571.1 hypothetical protein HG536_0D00930 [Torulaspora globosa]
MIRLQRVLGSRAVVSGYSCCLGRRFFNAGRAARNEQNSSFFGEMTRKAELDSDDPNKMSNRMSVMTETDDTQAVPIESITVESDKLLQRYIQQQQQPEKLAPYLLLSPLKRELYLANCKINGFYKPDTVVSLPGSKEKYKLALTRREVEALEPSVYVKSYRIKSSMKKATVLLRLLSGLDVKKALTQCHFSQKKIAQDVAELLQRGIQDGQKLGLDPDDLYIAQIWTGSDGWWMKRVDWKARGRVGTIQHPYVHVRCILKTKSVTKRRLAYEAEEKERRRKPWIQLADKPVRGAAGGFYKW